jgi:hypothetical protein
MAGGSMFDHDALGRALALYDQAREAWADNTSAANRATMQDELANLDRRARFCGWTEADSDVVTWARRRVETYAGMMTHGVPAEGARVACLAIGLIERAFRERGAE